MGASLFGGMNMFDRLRMCTLSVAAALAAAAGCQLLEPAETSENGARPGSEAVGNEAETIDPAKDPSKVGKLGPLIPFHKDAIHAALVWTGPKRKTPKVCFWMRPAEYRGTDLVDPNGRSPDGGDTGGFIQHFLEHVRGGSPFSNRLDRSVQSIIKDDIPLDNGLCFDLTHPDAFDNPGKYEVATYDPVSGTWTPEFTEADFDLNRDAFTNAGHSAGLNYNIFCAGNVQLPDGKLAFIGGHDKDGNHGIRKINIFDPATETWLHRPAPPVKTAYLAHPDGEDCGFTHPDANDEANTDPPLDSDMKYQRWYPSALTMPDGRVLILSGTDSVSGVPDSRVQTTTPEIYDPYEDKTIALENARKMLPNYPIVHVVQTGPGPDDWKLAVTGENANPLSPIPGGQVPADGDFVGNTYYFDIQAAEAAECHEPGEDHWELVDTARSPHHAAGTAALWELDHKGRAKSQKVVGFGGTDGNESVATVEMIDFQDDHPRWEPQEDLLHPVSDNFAVVLPTSEVLVLGGEADGDYEPKYNLTYEMFNPKTGKVKSLVQSAVPRADHTTALLLPDATVLVMGGDRTDRVPDDLIPGVPGDPDVGVPVAEVYKPPYLFKGPRPVIEDAPSTIEYGSSFQVKVKGGGKKIDSVVLIRLSPQTHKLAWESVHIELTFDKNKHGVKVKAPKYPSLAIPGFYMLFVLKDGVPSKAELVKLPL
jgi:hypothetical protein